MIMYRCSWSLLTNIIVLGGLVIGNRPSHTRYTIMYMSVTVVFLFQATHIHPVFNMVLHMFLCKYGKVIFSLLFSFT